MLTQKSISIIIPFYNEDPIKVVHNAHELLNIFKRLNIDFEIIIVDDSSRSVIENIFLPSEKIRVLVNEKNYGKGYSIRRGVLQAKKDLVLYTDCDLPVDIQDFLKKTDLFLSKEIENIIYIGDRTLKQSVFYPNHETSIPRKVFSQVFRWYAYLISKGKILDSQCPVKLIPSKYAKHWFQNSTINGYGFDLEILLMALADNIKVVKLSIVYRDGRRAMGWADSSKQTFQMMYDVAKNIKKNHNYRDS